MDRRYWGEKGLELVRLWWGNAWNKGGLLLIAGGMSALVGWIDKPIRFVLTSFWPNTPQSIWTDTPERIGWSLIALGLLVLAIGSYKRKPANPHDIELIGKFRKIFTADQIEFLATHNFHQNWHNSYISDVEDVGDHWRNAQHEFVDKQLNALLIEVKELSRDFANQENLGFNVYPGKPNRTLKTDPDLIKLTPETQARIEALNKTARDLANAANKLERLARRRLPTA
jgi:hypothetical protein